MNPLMFRFQPGTHVVYTLTETGTVQVWDLAPKGDVLAEHASFVYAVDAGSRGDLVFSGGWDGIVQQDGCLRWTDLESGEAIGSIGPPLITASAAIASDGTEVLVALGAGSNRPFAESEMATWPTDDRALAAFDVSGEAPLARISMVTGETLAVYTYSRPVSSDGHTRSILSLAVDPSFRRAAIGWWPGGVTVVDLETGEVLHDSSADTSPPPVSRLTTGSAVAWSSDGRWIAAGQALSRNRTLECRNLRDGDGASGPRPAGLVAGLRLHRGTARLGVG